MLIEAVVVVVEVEEEVVMVDPMAEVVTTLVEIVEICY